MPSICNDCYVLNCPKLSWPSRIKSLCAIVFFLFSTSRSLFFFQFLFILVKHLLFQHCLCDCMTISCCNCWLKVKKINCILLFLCYLSFLVAQSSSSLCFPWLLLLFVVIRKQIQKKIKVCLHLSPGSLFVLLNLFRYNSW